MPLLLATEKVFLGGVLLPPPSQTTAWLLYVRWMAIKYSSDSKCNCTTVQAEGAIRPCSFQNTPFCQCGIKLDFWHFWNIHIHEVFRGFSHLCLKDTYLLIINKWTDKTSRLMGLIALMIRHTWSGHLFFSALSHSAGKWIENSLLF